MVDTSPDAESPPPPSGRRRATLRDLIGSLAVLLLVVAAVVGFGRGCSFSPGGPSVDTGAAPSVDASREFAVAASSVDFAVRRPSLPEGWRANSASTSAVGRGASVVVRVGWLTPGGRFAQLSQSGGAVADVVASETGQEGARSTGSVDVSGTRWTIYPGRREEQAWVTSLGGVTVLITGTSGEDEFRTLATAVQTAAPLPR